MWSNFVFQLQNLITNYGINLIRAIVVFIIGYIIIKLSLKFATHAFARGRVDTRARKFLFKALKYLLFSVLIIITLWALGVIIWPFIIILLAMGAITAIATHTALSNIGSGLAIFINKTLKEGDYVTINDHSGIVKQVKLNHTTITTILGVDIKIPNKVLNSSVIINNTHEDVSRMVYTFVVTYNNDVEKVKEAIGSAIMSFEAIKLNPIPDVKLLSLSDRGLEFGVMVGVTPKDYDILYHAVQEEIFNELKKQKITLAYNLEIKTKQDKESLPYSNKSTYAKILSEQQIARRKSESIKKIDKPNVDKHAEKQLPEVAEDFVEMLNDIEIIEEDFAKKNVSLPSDEEPFTFSDFDHDIEVEDSNGIVQPYGYSPSEQDENDNNVKKSKKLGFKKKDKDKKNKVIIKK